MNDATKQNLHQFLDAAAGEGYVLNGVDAADLYKDLFPGEYAGKPPAPRTITIGQRTINAPMTVAPEAGVLYWQTNYPEFVSPNGLKWRGSIGDSERLDMGICHSTKADAIAHGEALAEYNRQACAAL